MEIWMPVNCRHQRLLAPADVDQSFPKSLLPPDISLKPFRSRKCAYVLRPTAVHHKAWLTIAGPQDRAPSTIVWIVSCQPKRANEEMLIVIAIRRVQEILNPRL